MNVKKIQSGMIMCFLTDLIVLNDMSMGLRRRFLNHGGLVSCSRVSNQSLEALIYNFKEFMCD